MRGDEILEQIADLERKSARLKSDVSLVLGSGSKPLNVRLARPDRSAARPMTDPPFDLVIGDRTFPGSDARRLFDFLYNVAGFRPAERTGDHGES